MKLAILFVAAAFLGIAYIRNKSVGDPYVAFNLLWLSVAVLINVGSKFVYEPSKTVMLCMLIGIIGFNISSFAPRLVVGDYRLGLFQSNGYKINFRRAYAISVVVLIISAFDSLQAIRAFTDGVTFSTIRDNYYTYTSSESEFFYYFRNYVLSPLRYVVIISAIIGVVKKERIGKWLFVNATIIIILQAITSGGRYTLMNTIFMLVCGFSLLRKKERIATKHKIGIFTVVALFSYVIVYLTNSRAAYITRNMTVIERLYHTVYVYFVGSTTYLGEVVKKTPSIIGSTHGINFLAGFIVPIFAALSFVNLVPFPAVFTVIGTYACEVLRIGPMQYYNSMPTIFGYFLIDGGYVFVFIEAWLFGYICKRLYVGAKKNNSLMCAMFILIFSQICNSSTRWFFYSPDYCLAFVYLRVIVDKVIPAKWSRQISKRI